jgi:hypothetical protein
MVGAIKLVPGFDNKLAANKCFDHFDFHKLFHRFCFCIMPYGGSKDVKLF